MTTPLDKLAEAIAGMTDQPWTDDVSDSYGSDWHIEGPPDSNLRRRPNGGYLIAKGMRSGDAAGVVALRNAAEELIAVARAAQKLAQRATAATAPYRHDPINAMPRTVGNLDAAARAIEDALAALDRKLGGGT